MAIAKISGVTVPFAGQSYFSKYNRFLDSQISLV